MVILHLLFLCSCVKICSSLLPLEARTLYHRSDLGKTTSITTGPNGEFIFSAGNTIYKAFFPAFPSYGNIGRMTEKVIAKNIVIENMILLNSTHLLVSEKTNRYLSTVGLQFGLTTRFAGNQASPGLNDGHRLAATFSSTPNKFTKSGNKIYICDGRALRMIDLDNGYLSTVIRDDPNLAQLNGIASSTSGTKLYIASSNSICQVSAAYQIKCANFYNTGSFEDIIALDDNVVMVADKLFGSVRVWNASQDTTYTICSAAASGLLLDGGADRCHFHHPDYLHVYRDEILVAEDYGSVRIIPLYSIIEGNYYSTGAGLTFSTWIPHTSSSSVPEEEKEGLSNPAIVLLVIALLLLLGLIILITLYKTKRKNWCQTRLRKGSDFISSRLRLFSGFTDSQNNHGNNPAEEQIYFTISEADFRLRPGTDKRNFYSRFLNDSSPLRGKPSGNSSLHEREGHTFEKSDHVPGHEESPRKLGRTTLIQPSQLNSGSRESEENSVYMSIPNSHFSQRISSEVQLFSPSLATNKDDGVYSGYLEITPEFNHSHYDDVKNCSLSTSPHSDYNLQDDAVSGYIEFLPSTDTDTLPLSAEREIRRKQVHVDREMYERIHVEVLPTSE